MVTVTGGDRLENYLARLSTKFKGKTTTLSVGFLAGSTYPDGTSVPLVAAVQEFGSPTNNIPARPYFRGMVNKRSGEWPGQMANLLKITNNDVDRTMKLMGELIVGELKESINEFNGVPLAPATIARKGSEKQLIDTAHMLNSVDYMVED